MTNTIWIISLEPIQTRYTGQWHVGIPEQLATRANDKFNIVQIDGDTNSGKPTEGAFLDFVGTNLWKSEQAIKFFNLVKEGKVLKGDKVLITDAWNPTILQIKYMSDLMGLDLELHGIWHAGSYDPQDFLGRLIQDKRWTRNTERAIFHALDVNYYATDFHVELFADGVLEEHASVNLLKQNGKIVKSGQPHETLLEALEPYFGAPEDKENIILFPHRLAPEKQPELFRKLAAHLPQYEFVICQEQELTKDEYHSLLKRAKVVFSANLQETLGISALEAIKCGTIPMLPNRLSYSEMYEEVFLYPSRWTQSERDFDENLEMLVLKLTHYMENFDTYSSAITKQLDRLNRDYLSGEIMYSRLLNT